MANHFSLARGSSRTGHARAIGHRFEVGALSCVAAFFFSVYLELFYEAWKGYQGVQYDGLLASSISLPVLLRVGALFLVAFALCVTILAGTRARRVLSFLFRHRLAITLCVTAVLVLLCMSGSSIGIYSKVFPGEDSGLCIGIPREIRSDEFAVTVPLAASQANVGFSSVTDLLRGTLTNVTIGYGLPSWSLITLFKPFQWGYLVLGFERGLSFFWMVRYAAAFLVTFDCALLYTRGNRWLSASATLMVVLSPFTMWWGAFELFIFGQALVLILNAFLREGRMALKALDAVVLAWLCGCYLFVMYPAWMVPLFFVFALMGLWVVGDFRREVREGSVERGTFKVRRDVPILAIPLALLGFSVVLVFQYAATEVLEVASTVYPGSRFETGGGGAALLLNYGEGLFFSVDPARALPNACEASKVFSLFPAGIVIAILALVKLRKRDFLLISLLVLDAVFLVFMCVGVPAIVAKVTLLSNVPVGRMVIATGYLDVVLLLRGLVVYGEGRTSEVQAEGTIAERRVPSRLLTLAASVVVSAVMVLAMRQLSGYLRLLYCVMLFAIMTGLVYVIVRLVATRGADPLYHKALLALLAMTLVPSGLTVNPIQVGAPFYSESSLMRTIRSVNESEGSSDTLWLAVDSNIIVPNLCAAAGAPTLNCTNSIPNLDAWHSVDPTGAYESVYNRYAHILVRLTDEATSFDLTQPDHFEVDLTYGDLRTLGITNLISTEPLEGSVDDGVHLDKKAEVDGYYLYGVTYE